MNAFTGELHSSGEPANYPHSKILRIQEWAKLYGFEELGEMFCDMLVKEVRNAFTHSSYILQKDSFNIRGGQGVRIENVIDPQVSLNWLMPRLELGINVGLCVIQSAMDGIRSYTESKIVQGRLHGEENDPIPVELTVQEGYGLTGFRSPPANPNSNSQ